MNTRKEKNFQTPATKEKKVRFSSTAKGTPATKSTPGAARTAANAERAKKGKSATRSAREKAGTKNAAAELEEDMNAVLEHQSQAHKNLVAAEKETKQMQNTAADYVRSGVLPQDVNTVMAPRHFPGSIANKDLMVRNDYTEMYMNTLESLNQLGLNVVSETMDDDEPVTQDDWKTIVARVMRYKFHYDEFTENKASTETVWIGIVSDMYGFENNGIDTDPTNLKELIEERRKALEDLDKEEDTIIENDIDEELEDEEEFESYAGAATNITATTTTTTTTTIVVSDNEDNEDNQNNQGNQDNDSESGIINLSASASTAPVTPVTSTAPVTPVAPVTPATTTTGSSSNPGSSSNSNGSFVMLGNDDPL
jgi:hypothetical protein